MRVESETVLIVCRLGGKEIRKMLKIGSMDLPSLKNMMLGLGSVNVISKCVINVT